MSGGKKLSRVEQLEAAGVLDSTTLSAAEKAKVESLHDDEVAHLISSRQKVGDYSEANHPAGRPWIL
jgi:hypothetical protein